MSKLCGFISAEPGPFNASQQLQDMAASMRHAPAILSEFVFDNGGFAVLHTDSTESSGLFQSPDRQQALAMAGYFVEPLPLTGGLPTTMDTGSSTDSRLGALYTGLAAEGSSLLPRLNGVFALASYDGASQRLQLANDRYGFAPLYYLHDERGLWFASEVKALLQVLDPLEPDWEAYADFFYVGHMLGQKTLFKRISAFAPGQVMTYQHGHLQITKYHDFTQTRVMEEAEVSVDRLHELFVQAVDRLLQTDKPNTMLLSGGFDSRLILGTLHSLGARPRVLTLEHANEKRGADGQFARAIAQTLGLECEFRPTRPNFYASKECMEVFSILDGMVPTWQLFIGQVYAELDSSLGKIWDGMVLGVALGGGQEIKGGIKANMSEFLDMRVRNRPLLKRILTPQAFRQLDDTFMGRIKQAVAQVPPSPNQYLYFLLQNRTRRRITPNPYQLFASKVEPRTPGADADLLDYILAIPPSLRLEHKIYIDLLRKKFPSLVQTPIITGGKLVYFDQSLKTLKNEVIRSTRATLKRNLRKVNARGKLRSYTHRTMTGEERELSDVITQVLKRNDFDRPFYNRTQLQQWFVQYCAGDGRYHDLFAVVFYIELWHLLFIDRSLMVLD